MRNSPPRIRPAPSLRPIAKRFWKEQVVASDKQKERLRLASSVRENFWEPVWESRKLRIKRQQTPPAGTAFGVSAPRGSTLGPPIIECDGEEIAATGLTGDDIALDEVTDMMLKLVKILKNLDRQSGWASVKVEGSSTALQKLRKAPKRDSDAPVLWDPQTARALKRSRRS
jgi:hypothetical protein